MVIDDTTSGYIDDAGTLLDLAEGIIVEHALQNSSQQSDADQGDSLQPAVCSVAGTNARSNQQMDRLNVGADLNLAVGIGCCIRQDCSAEQAKP